MSDVPMDSTPGQAAVKEVLFIMDLIRELVNKGADAFRRKYPHPFLLLRHVPPDETKGMGIETVETSAKNLQEELDRVKPVMALVLRKSDRNTFLSKITVGRAKNNDIIIRAPKISKLHSAFSIGKRGKVMELIDMGSHNGTWLNGIRLSKNKASPVKNGDRVAFWRYEFEYLELDPFIAFLSSPPSGGDHD